MAATKPGHPYRLFRRGRNPSIDGEYHRDHAIATPTEGGDVPGGPAICVKDTKEKLGNAA